MKMFIYLAIATIRGSSNYGDRDLTYLAHKMNDELLLMNRLSAKFGWDASTRPSRDIFLLKERFSLIRNNWKNEICSRFDYPCDDLMPLSRTINLLCRGPLYSSNQLRRLMAVSDTLMTNYATRRICRRETDGLKCYHGEPDLKTLMSMSRLYTCSLPQYSRHCGTNILVRDISREAEKEAKLKSEIAKR